MRVCVRRYPVTIHCVVLAIFASLIAPFGGFFASGFKRALKVKDFGHTIPGHGGITDRMVRTRRAIFFLLFVCSPRAMCCIAARVCMTARHARARAATPLLACPPLTVSPRLASPCLPACLPAWSPQFVMGAFAYLYYSTFVSAKTDELGVLAAALLLQPESQLRLFDKLREHLVSTGLLAATP